MKPSASIALTLRAEDSPTAAFDDDSGIDTSVHCRHCSALCCRLTVVLGPLDVSVPPDLTSLTATGLRVMAHGTDGYCVALGADGRSCSIYEQRPQDCRNFTMGGPYCRAERARILGSPTASG